MSGREIEIESHLGLVHACCKRFKNRSIEYEDLYSAGCLGLVKAAKNFDFDRSTRFSTYAVPVILGEIKQLFRESGTVKVSRSLKELSLKAKKICDGYKMETGEDMPLSVLAQRLGTDTEKAAEAVNSSLPPLSLSGESDENSGGIDIPVDSPEERLTERLSLNQAISSLEENDRRLIRLRYYKRKTQQETAEALEMTQVQVSRREKKILSVIREKMT